MADCGVRRRASVSFGQQEDDVGLGLVEHPAFEKDQFDARKAVKKETANGCCIVDAEQFGRKNEAEPAPSHKKLAGVDNEGRPARGERRQGHPRSQGSLSAGGSRGAREPLIPDVGRIAYDGVVSGFGRNCEEIGDEDTCARTERADAFAGRRRARRVNVHSIDPDLAGLGLAGRCLADCGLFADRTLLADFSLFACGLPFANRGPSNAGLDRPRRGKLEKLHRGRRKKGGVAARGVEDAVTRPAHRPIDDEPRDRSGSEEGSASFAGVGSGGLGHTHTVLRPSDRIRRGDAGGWRGTRKSPVSRAGFRGKPGRPARRGLRNLPP